MIKFIKKDTLFKRAFIKMLFFMLIFSMLMIVLEYQQLKVFYNNQMRVTQGLVGSFALKYPEEEVKIIDSLFSINEMDNINAGKKILSKYGYHEGVQIYNNQSYNRNLKNFIFQSSIKYLIILLMAAVIVLYIIRYITEELMLFSKAINRVMEGDFSIKIDSNKEGILSILKSQFHQMSKRLNMNVEELNKEKENMKSVVTDMSHQLKTPIASIKLSNDLLLEENLSNEERMEFLQKCNEDIDKLEWLTSSLIKMSRLEAGIIELKKEKSNIKNTIIKAVNGVYIKALNKNIEINMENLHDAVIEHDVKWTKEALTNILENAVKYTSHGGSIKIATSPLALLFKIEIEDNGIGIDEEEINNIFKKFYRGNCKQVTDAEGLGVGLYLARKIIENQGGSIIVHSWEGKGSKFNVLLQNCHEN